MEYISSYSYGTRKGRRHDNNEDSILVMDLGDSFVFGVFDGISGLHDGVNASRTAMELIRNSISADTDSMLVKRPKEYLFNLITSAHECIQQIGNDVPMGTTVTLCLIDGDGYLHTVHVGDSPLYLATKEHSVKLSDDDSFMGKLTKYLGMPGKLNLDTAYCKRKIQNGALVLCTDGLMDGVGEDWLNGLYETPITEKTASRVIDHAYENSNTGDDISLVLVELSGGDITTAMTQDSQTPTSEKKNGKGWNILSFAFVFILGVLIGYAMSMFLGK